MQPLSIKKILVPFSFNNSFVAPVKMAIELAEKSNAVITILFVYNPLERATSNYIRGMILPLTPIKNDDVEGLKKSITKFFDDHGIILKSYNLQTDTDYLISAIVNLNKKVAFDIIVVPDSSKSALDRITADINVLDLMRLTKSAIIATPNKSTIENIKRIILPIRNVKNWHDKLPFTLAIAKITGASIYILGIGNTNSERVINQIKTKVSICQTQFNKHQIPYSIDFSFNHGDPTFDVYNLALYKHADLIVVSPPENNSKLKSYLNTSLYNKLMEKGDVPIMGVSLT